MVLVQSSFHTTWASLFEMELEPNSLDCNGNELEHKLELEDMKCTMGLLEAKNIIDSAHFNSMFGSSHNASSAYQKK